MRTARTLAGLVLVGSGLVGCSGDDSGGASGAPEDASMSDFCAAFNGLFDQVLSQASPGADSAAMARALRSWAEDIEKVGTPPEMPDDARHGFELFVDQARKIDEHASLQDLEKLGEGLSEADRADGQAFNDWTRDNCPLDLPSPSAG